MHLIDSDKISLFFHYIIYSFSMRVLQPFGRSPFSV